MLIKQETFFICPWCEGQHKTLEKAEDCLDSHNVVFIIQESFVSPDCWGRPEEDWRDTKLIFKSYKNAKKYTEPLYRIKIKELL